MPCGLAWLLLRHCLNDFSLANGLDQFQAILIHTDHFAGANEIDHLPIFAEIIRQRIIPVGYALSGRHEYLMAVIAKPRLVRLEKGGELGDIPNGFLRLLPGEVCFVLSAEPPPAHVDKRLALAAPDNLRYPLAQGMLIGFGNLGRSLLRFLFGSDTKFL
jgi:hypothetical protein